MDCEEAERRIQESLDGAPLPDEIGEHLVGCDDCREAAQRLRAANRLLEDAPTLAWSPELTARVLSRVRAERTRNRFFAAAAAALILLSAWLGVDALYSVPGLSEAESAVVASVPIPESPSEALHSLRGGLNALADDALAALGKAPLSPGIPVAAGALLLLLLLNGALILQPLAARRRHP